MNTDEENYSSEDNRKRNRKEGEEQIFNKSQKIYRTSAKNRSEDEGKLDAIIKMMHILTAQTNGIATEIREIKAEQREYKKEIRKIQEKLKKVNQSNMAIRKENDELKIELKLTTNRIEQLKKEQRENNDQKTITKHQNALDEELGIMEELEKSTIEDIWRKFKTAIQTTAQTVIGYQSKKERIWLTDETWSKIEDRRKLKLQIAAARQHDDMKNLEIQYKEVKRSHRNDKRIYLRLSKKSRN
ncbi:hypothetical protein ILUMI_22511 [Ignelater luminosus]|uniref:Uncharacterized protein n=1 Tax=Ignelater luminosus TaxID=2038154 RepID=A0A8K0CCK7_IGNLU|nr:hypothetical protein ILUMI_22511 [Ignelater luminosus]